MIKTLGIVLELGFPLLMVFGELVLELVLGFLFYAVSVGLVIWYWNCF